MDVCMARKCPDVCGYNSDEKGVSEKNG